MSLDNVLARKTKEELIDIMYDALDLMQQYNGRSRFHCIAVACGYEAVESENDDGTYTYKFKKQKT